MVDSLPVATFLIALLATILAFLAYLAARRIPAPIAKADFIEMLRRESESLREASEANSWALRIEIGQVLSQNQIAALDVISKQSEQLIMQVDVFGTRLEAINRTTESRINEIGTKLNSDIEQLGQAAASNRETLRSLIEQKLDSSAAAHVEAARDLREELGASFQRMRLGISETLNDLGNLQKERLEANRQAIENLAERQNQSGEQLRKTVEGRLDLLRNENNVELEKVRATVDEKLQSTLESRLHENFDRIVEQFNKAYEVFGEMRTISAHVGDLKNVLTNPKLRGTFGEIQLSMLLEDFLSPTQYIKDAQVKEGTGERVEFAIRLPTIEGTDILLPVDAKFPRDDHEHMLQAIETGDGALVDQFREQLESRIKTFAKEISKKYINPPRTTERAILFLPTESLFAEVLRLPGLFEFAQRECNVMLAGPTTFAAILYAFQVSHRSVTIAQRSRDVWKILSAVRTEFKRYDKTVSDLARQLNTAASSVKNLGNRARLMDRALRDVETMPDNGSAAKLLGLEEGLTEDTTEAEMPSSYLVETADTVISDVLDDDEPAATAD
jgi:DNA recombination protein RmuC